MENVLTIEKSKIPIHLLKFFEPVRITAYTKGSVMPTSVKDRFNESGEELYFFVKNKKYYSNLDAIRLPLQTLENRPMGIEREKDYPNAKRNKFAFNYRVRDAQRKAGQHASDRKAGLRREFIPCVQRNWRQEEAEGYKMGSVDPHRAALRGGLKFYQGKFAGRQDAEMFNSPRAKTLGKNIPTIWQINPEPHNFQKELGVKTDHFAVYPQALCEIPIKFGCPPNGIVLDPFCGSGTTCVVAKKLKRNYIGIDISKDYCKIAELRLSQIPKPLL